MNYGARIDQARGWTIGVRFPEGTGNFSVRLVLTGSGARPANYPMGKGTGKVIPMPLN